MITPADSVEHVGPYRVEEQLGEGGMGTVFRGFHGLLERPVALKCLRPDVAISDTARQRFLREAQAAARLNHSAVVQIYDIFEHGDNAWIAMELVDGASLSQILESGPLPWARVLSMGQTVAEALVAAHAVAILHRDLKTENVLLSRTGEVKVLDFGLAKDLEAESNPDDSQAQGLLGTPRCLSPEQAKGLPLDYRSDLFSFGVLLYEMLTGISPFRGSSLWQTLSNICSVKQKPVSELVPDIPDELSNLVDELLAKEPSKRPKDAQTVGALLRDIELRHSAEISLDSGTFPPQTLRPGPAQGSRGSSSWTSDTALKERRHVLVISCELRADDPEALHDVLPALQQRIQRLLGARRGCFVDTPGDRLAVCVGYPQAFEDDAPAAVGIARDILQDVSSFARQRTAEGHEDGLRARCGIHAGIAFTPASSVGGQPELGPLLDDTIDVARAADTDQILVSDAVIPLLPDSLCHDPTDANGRLGPLRAIRSDVDPASEDAAALPGTPEPPIGRDTEIRLLVDTFRSVTADEFRVVQVCGEGGMGKSRLLAGFRHALPQEGMRWITLSGSPETTNSPFFPVSTLLGHFFDLPPETPMDEQLPLIQAQAEGLQLNLATQELLPYLAPHLSAVPGDETVQLVTPEQRKQRVLEALSSLVASAAEQRPVVLVFEDLHWLDPSTLEWIQLLVEARATTSLLLVLTFRPHFVPPWGHRADVIQLNLNPLTAEPTRALIARLVGPQDVPDAVIERIIDKADGVPLFLEQLARTVAETQSADAAEIPGTLRGSLMARLDRLGSAKTVAQYASVIGREFPLQVLQALLPIDESTLEAELEHLMDAGILFRRGFDTRARYIFKHALIRDAAYDSLLKKDRRHLHREIVRALEESFPHLGKHTPEILARHCTLGGAKGDAVGHWGRAAKQALSRSANIEAISHSREGLELLTTLTDSEAHAALELDLQDCLVEALSVATGYANPELEAPLLRIEELAERLDDGPRVTAALRGLFHLAHYSGDAQGMLDHCDRFLAHAKQLEDHLLIMEAHFQSGLTFFSLGKLREACEHKNAGLRIQSALTPEDGDADARAIGHGKAVVSQSLLALALWIQGAPDRSADLARETIDFSEGSDPLSQTMAHHNAASISLFAECYDEAREHARAAIELAQQHQIFLLPLSQMVFDLATLKGGAMPETADLQGAEKVDEEAAIPRVHRTIAELRDLGVRFGLSFFLCHLAEVHLARGESAEVEDILDTIHDLIESLDERVWLADLLRIRGEWLCSLERFEEAEHTFQRALVVASEQGAKSFELTAALGLAHLLASRQRPDEARDALRRTFDTFDEGFDFPALARAQRFLGKDGGPRGDHG